jgi:glycosidase
MDSAQSTTLRLHSPETAFSLELDSKTGLPTKACTEVSDHESVAWSFTTNLTIVVGGTEERDPTGGLRYVNTERISDLRLRESHPIVIHAGTSILYEYAATLGGLDVTLQYRLFPQSPYLEFAVRLSHPHEHEFLIRGLEWQLQTQEEIPGSWVLNTPGNCLHRNAAVNELGEATLGVSPVGGLRGSSGVVMLSDSSGISLSVWPNTASEVVLINVDLVESDAVRITVATELGAALTKNNQVDLRLGCIDLQPVDFAELTEQFPDWLARYGFTSPPVKPAWVRTSSIYEVQIGTSMFWGGHEYTRYAAISDLIADLDRIQSLGFSVLQLMPKQPYPSYNVHDYYDIDVSYGDRHELEQLVADCHERGMRVILDVLLHGVLDQESIDGAVQGVLDGPYADRLDEPPGDSFSADVSDWATYLIAWSRHIMDFAPHWRGGSPPRTELEDLHPEWFFRDSAGNVTSIYTKAFDARSASWQRYFRDAMIFLLDGLGVDGFRFDAPTYNEFGNWAPWARHRASASPLGCISLFVDMRRDIKAIRPDALMYTEPSGHLLRRSMDLNYNYDEQWLVTALAKPRDAAPRGVRNARQFAQWMQDRDAFLPPGSQTAHHIDSHDTFWWPAWGAKWRREQFPLPVVRALTATFLSLDGPYMMFTGGEDGVEDVLTALNGSRRTHPHLWAVPGEFHTAGDQDLLHIVRATPMGECLEILVNLAQDRSVDFELVSPDLAVDVHSEGCTWTRPFASGVLAPAGILALRTPNQSLS